ncbi:MAG: AI-2E family transporter [Flavipsychrobacter sp.]
MNNESVKRLILLVLILLLGVAISWQLSAFFPGLLGAITLYILVRERYMKLTQQKGWNKWLTASLFILGSILLFALPVILLIQLLLPKLNKVLSNKKELEQTIQMVSQKIQELELPFSITSEQLLSIAQDITASVPAVLGATANILTNGVLALFILYFMLLEGAKMEKHIKAYTPLKESNVNDIWDATRTMVRSNAIGIPVLAASQAIAAAIGYWIFGVDAYILWGVLTGIFSIVPLLGCMIVWVPICIYLFAIGDTSAAIWLAIYSFVITGGVDNVLRFTILKKLGDIHPVTTMLGIIIGVPLFGFMGFIFGPLLISYLLLLIKVYRIEFVGEPVED